MTYRMIDGSSSTVAMDFLDENDLPIVPRPGYPKLSVLDKDKQVIADYNAVPSVVPGTWEASIFLPLMGVKRTEELRLRWRIRTEAGDRTRIYDTILVDPKVEERDSEIVVLERDESSEFALPFRYTSATPTTFQIFGQNNDQLGRIVDVADMETDPGIDVTSVVIPTFGIRPSLHANILMARTRINGKNKVFSYRYWVITPQIALASSMLEGFLNKSRIENIIPELQYTSGDLISYLERGLYMFNMTAFPTAFTGTNMQGALLDGWVTCSTYWAIGAQLIAEGSLAFDFSGQGVTLNVDRTPALESALGRIESRIQDTIVPLKKQLATQGIIAGDGSIGATALRNSFSLGTLGMINSPTTRIGGFSNYIGRRF